MSSDQNRLSFSFWTETSDGQWSQSRERNEVVTRDDVPYAKEIEGVCVLEPNSARAIGRLDFGTLLDKRHCRISRKHCTLQMIHGEWYATGHSRNGTQIVRKGAETILLRAGHCHPIQAGDILVLGGQARIVINGID